jgi:histidinol-phosphate aminotransferase
MSASTENNSFTPSEAVRAIDVYRTPPPMNGVDMRLDGTQRSDPPEALFRSIQQLDPAVTARYPNAGELESDIAEYWNLDPEQVLVTTGADDAISRVMRVALEPGRQALLTRPTFDMLEVYARLAGGEIIWTDWLAGDLPVQNMIDRITLNTTLAAVVSPNNPTGLPASLNALTKLSDSLSGGLLLVDAVYGDYSERDVTRELLQLKNVVIVRSFSKAWALAGARVGYILGPSTLIEEMKKAGGPYPVSVLSLLLARSMLKDGRENVDRHVQALKGERERLFALLNELGVSTTRSDANFLLARFADRLFALYGLASLGIWTRQFPERPLLADHLRITCPSDENGMLRLENALRTILQPEALLLDMDGVLADVSGSYRAAIIATANSFGVKITAEEIQNLKERGNANNDWALTQALLRLSGVDVSLSEVKARFETFYQGTDETPGLRNRETLLPDRGLLERLASQLPLAVVTGRPRQDAERFLADHDIAGLFAAVVCMEDAPPKPDPTPVRLALDRLSIRRAWMVGDTVDDIRAARAAGVLPLGFLPPHLDADARTLRDEGAAEVTDSFERLEELLS